MQKSLLPLSLSLSVLVAGMAQAAPPKATPAPTTKKAATTAAPGAPDPAVGNALFQQAIAQTQAGKIAQAEATYNKLLKMFPKAAPAWANLGLLAAQENRLEDAAAYLSKATAYEPKTAPFWAQLSSVELRRGRAAEAEAAARKTLALEPGNLFGLGNLAGALMRQERYAEAVAPLDKLRSLPGANTVQASFSLAVALSRSNQRTRALAVARKLADQNPGQPNLQLMLADLAAQLKDYKTAQKAYDNVYALVPTDMSAAINSAVATELSGDPNGAKEKILKILEAHPREAMAQFQLGRLYYIYPSIAAKGENNFAKAAEYYNRAVLIDPKNPLFLTNYALALMFQGPDHFDEANKLFLSALNVAPNNTVAHMGLAYLAEKQGKADAAIAQYRAVLTTAPTDYDARRRLAGLLYATGKHDEAYHEFQTLAQVTPGEQGAVALKELASLQYNDRRYEDAQKSYAAAVARDPKDGLALVGLGQALEQLKEFPEAQKQYEQAIVVAPKTASAYVALSTLLENQGKRAEATKVYEQFVAADPHNNTAHWQLSQFYVDQKRDEDALREMRKLTIQRDDPTHLLYLLGPANLMLQRGHSAEAVTEIQTLIPQNPRDSVELRYRLAEAQEAAGKKEDSEQTLIQLSKDAKTPPARLKAATALAQFYDRGSRWEDAGHYYEEALQADPSADPARVGLLKVRTQQNKPEEAANFLETLAMAQPIEPNLTAAASVHSLYLQQRTPEKYVAFAKRIAEQYPRSHNALNLYAEALLQPGATAPLDQATHAQVADIYRQMTVLDARDTDAFYHLGEQEEALGHKDQAIAAYQGAMRTVAGTTNVDNPSVDFARRALKRLGAPEVAATTLPAPAPTPTTPANPAPTTPTTPTTPSAPAAPSSPGGNSLPGSVPSPKS